MARLYALALAISILGATAVFATAEAIHAAGMNPFETAASDALPPLVSAQPASTIEARAGTGSSE